MTEHIVAVFETESAADAAVSELTSSGVPQSAVRRYMPGTAGVSSSSPAVGGFWAWLLGEEDGIEAQRARYPQDHDIYDRRAQSGNAVVSVTLLDDAMAERAAEILESCHPLHFEEDINAGRESAPAAAKQVPPVTTDKEQVIPLKEEELTVGKRMVDHGVTRLRRYVVESPVEKVVTLRGERVTIERRSPIDGATGGTFEERTVEVRETEEVPVVEKTARVVEEVLIRKEATERTETVRDTVRREEVEVTEGKPQTPGNR